MESGTFVLGLFDKESASSIIYVEDISFHNPIQTKNEVLYAFSSETKDILIWISVSGNCTMDVNNTHCLNIFISSSLEITLPKNECRNGLTEEECLRHTHEIYNILETCEYCGRGQPGQS